jgi:hypothetical protein
MKRSTYCAKVCFPKRQQLRYSLQTGFPFDCPHRLKRSMYGWLNITPLFIVVVKGSGANLISPSECNRAWPARFQEVKPRAK